MRRKPKSEPPIVRFVNGMSDQWSYSLPQLSEADIRQLHQGSVPAWMRDTIAWWLSDHPIGAVPPGYQQPEVEEKTT